MYPTTDRPSRRRRLGAAAVAAGLAVAGAVFAGGGTATASSHREAPLIQGDPKADNTDLYAFVSPDRPDSVTIIANWIPFEEPNGGPNFFPFQAGAHYDVDIDNNGDGVADTIYRWVFTDHDKRGTNTFLYNNGPVTSLSDPNLLFKQTYTLQEITAAGTRTIASGTAAPSDVGKASMPNYAKLRDAAITPVADGGRTFAGQADDPFFLDLRVFDLLYGANLAERGHDTLSGYNVNTIALQVPKNDIALRGNATRNPVVGIWSTTEKRTLTLGTGTATPTGPFVQVSRLGNPLVNEVVVPSGLKDAFNAIPPSVDHTVAPVVQRVLDPEVPKLIQTIYGVPAPKAPRNDLVEIFLTGIAKHAPTLDGSAPPIQADLNSQVLNKDVESGTFVPSEELRLNLAVAPTAAPKRLGVLAGDLQGFPNGRRLTDDVVDIELQALEGAAQTGKLVPALAAGDKVNANDRAFGRRFPYLALPNVDAVNQAGGHDRAASATPASGNGSSARGTQQGSSTMDGRMLAVSTSAGVLALVLIVGGVILLRRRRIGPAHLLSGHSG